MANKFKDGERVVLIDPAGVLKEERGVVLGGDKGCYTVQVDEPDGRYDFDRLREVTEDQMMPESDLISVPDVCTPCILGHHNLCNKSITCACKRNNHESV
jgi:hypothetical protein